MAVSSGAVPSSYSYYYYYYEEEEGSGWGWNGSRAVGGCGWAAPVSDWAASFWLLPALYLLVFGLGLAGNGLVLATACCGRGGAPRSSSSSSSEAYLAHLALADLCFVATLPLWAAYTALGFHWPFGAALCKLSSYLVLLNMFASAFCLAALSLERYLAVVRHRALPAASPSPPPSSPFPSSRGAALAAVWLGAALLALPALLLRETRPSSSSSEASLSCDLDLSGVASSPEEEARWLAGLSLASTALGFLLPLLLMSLCYRAIGAAVGRHFQGRGRRRRRARLLRILAGLVLVFGGCWLPFHALKSLYVLGGLGLLELPCAALALLLRLHPYATCLAYLNSCLNPLLYAALDPRFRHRGRRLLRTLRWTRPMPAPHCCRRCHQEAPEHDAPPAALPPPSLSSSLSGQTRKSEAPSLSTKP